MFKFNLPFGSSKPSVKKEEETPETEQQLLNGDATSQTNMQNQENPPKQENDVDSGKEKEGKSKRRVDHPERQRQATEVSEAAVQRHPAHVKLQKKFRAQMIQIQQLEDELALVKDGLQRERSLHSTTKKHLEEKVTELQAANQFLSQNDQLSCADVVSLAETLNFDIGQLAAQVASTYGDFDMTGEASSREAHRAQGSIEKKLHIPVSGLVQHPGIKSNKGLRSAFVEFFIQSFLINVTCLEVLNTRWSQHSELDHALDHIYRRMTVEGSTATRSIAGKWRTLTHAVSQEEHSTDDLSEKALYYTRKILVAFGANGVPSEEEFDDGFRGDIEPIISNLLRLNTAIKEKISSCIIRPLVPRPGDQVDGESMVDANSPDVDGEPGSQVLLTVALGLYKVDNIGQNYSVLLKPQIILERLLHNLDTRQGVEETKDPEVEEVVMASIDGQ